MPVYEATSDKQLNKIIKWLSTEPPETFSLKCLARVADAAKEKEQTIRIFKGWKKMYPTFGAFVCEDNEDNIRFVLLRFIKGKPEYDYPKPIMRIVTGLMKHTDYEANNAEFFIETARWIGKHDHEQFGVEMGEVGVDEKYFNFLKMAFGDKNVVKASDEFDTPWFGKMFYATLDFKPFLGE